MNALVTGGEGFVGGYLVSQLLQEGHRVVATSQADPVGTRPASGGPPTARDDHGSAAPEWVRLDVLEWPTVAEVVGDAAPDVVFHLAGFSSGALARRRPAEAVRTNAVGTLSVLSAVSQSCPGARIVVTGSADVYGDPGPEPVMEDRPVRPVTEYGVSKAVQEYVARGLATHRGLDLRVARMFPLVGPGQAEAFVVPSFCRQAAAIASGAADPVLRVGNLHVERDFTDVRDGAAALRAIADMEAPSAVAYNVCSGRRTSIREVLDWILDAAGIDPDVEIDPDRVRAGDPARIVGSSRRLTGDTGWRPRRDVREGVRDTYSWVQTVQ